MNEKDEFVHMMPWQILYKLIKRGDYHRSHLNIEQKASYSFSSSNVKILMLKYPLIVASSILKVVLVLRPCSLLQDQNLKLGRELAQKDQPFFFPSHL